MTLQDIIKDAKPSYPPKRITIVGVNPLIEELINNYQLFSDLLRIEKDIEITIIYESETENFNQSLVYDNELSKNRIEFDKLQTYRIRLIGSKRGKDKNIVGFIEDVLAAFDESEREIYHKKIRLFQENTRHFVNLIKIDNNIWYSLTALEIPSIEMYQKITMGDSIYQQLDSYIKFLLNEKSGGIFLSVPGDELIELYDMHSYPRGIYPRKAFYSSEYQRYSIWGFVFNRKGELLLHKRSDFTEDNRALWDKSIGGHVDLVDSSTIVTAKRELVEEMFLPEAEYTKYMQAQLGDIIDFGEWNIEKRAEKYFIESIKGLDINDWVIFRATDRNEKNDNVPMTIRRKSPRLIHVKDKDVFGEFIPLKDNNGEILKDTRNKIRYKESKEIWYTRFISDVYLFIAPENFIDTEEQMNHLMHNVEQKGSSSAHKIISITKLFEDVVTNSDQYTDDIVFMCSEKKWLLLEFSESIKYIFKE